jgi:hypothetical protein
MNVRTDWSLNQRSIDLRKTRSFRRLAWIACTPFRFGES